MSPSNSTLPSKYPELEIRMTQLEKDKKEAAMEEDFEKALECKKAIKDL